MYRVLIIDDDKLARKGIISIVDWAACGMTVVGDVANGAMGLQFLAENEVDLAVVDLSMPVLSGLDFIKESRRLYPALQYVVLSFHEEFEYVQSALRYGALDYISKLRLEQEDCNKLFLHVREVLDSAHRAAKEASASELPAQVLEQLERDCLSLFWIYDDAQLESLAARFCKLQISVRQLDRMLVAAAQAVRRDFALSVHVEPFAEAKAGAAQLTVLRDAVRAGVAGGGGGGTLASSVLRAVLYTEQNLTEEGLKAENAAEAAGMSRGYFSGNFKKYTNRTFNSFVRSGRLRLAKQLLRQADWSAAALAERVGYRDEKYFSRLFLAAEGVNCTEYRRQIASEQAEG